MSSRFLLKTSDKNRRDLVVFFGSYEFITFSVNTNPFFPFGFSFYLGGSDFYARVWPAFVKRVSVFKDGSLLFKGGYTIIVENVGVSVKIRRFRDKPEGDIFFNDKKVGEVSSGKEFEYIVTLFSSYTGPEIIALLCILALDFQSYSVG